MPITGRERGNDTFTTAVPPQNTTVTTTFIPRKPQYLSHHFVPQFVLRGFATTASKSLDKSNPIIDVYSMETGSITPSRVARYYGHEKMYQDLSAADEMHIEKALSVLEGQASRVIKCIKQTQADNARFVELKRHERNAVRKFLFVMKYRMPLFRDKYNCSLEGYGHGDRAELVLFMKRKGFTKPIQVWLHTIKTILDTNIDPRGNWQDINKHTCFIHDAQWFLHNMVESFMAFCQPQNPDDEFILSDSAFGIHEGPTRTILDTGKPYEQEIYTVPTGTPHLSSESHEWHVPWLEEGLLERAVNQSKRQSEKKITYTEYHKLAPFSRKLLLVLRSDYLRPETRPLRWMLSLVPETSEPLSLFDHLHLDAPLPSYGVHFVSGDIRQAPFSDEDTFKFTLHKLSHQDVLLFNSVILNEAKLNLTWHNHAAMARTLQEYLEKEEFRIPLDLALNFGQEEIERMPRVRRREQLKKLMESLDGHDKKPSKRFLRNHVQQSSVFEEFLLKTPSYEGYFRLGGTLETWLQDKQQASLVSKMRRIIIDALPVGPYSLHYHKGALRNALVLFSTLSPTVIFLHVGNWRLMQKRRRSEPHLSEEEIMEPELKGMSAENAVANLVGKIPQQHLSKLIQTSFRNVYQNYPRMEYRCLSLFGGIVSSFLLENTPCYDPQFDLQVLNPYREEEISKSLLIQEVKGLVWVKRNGLIEAKWGKEVAKYVWDWLYSAPEIAPGSSLKVPDPISTGNFTQSGSQKEKHFSPDRSLSTFTPSNPPRNNPDVVSLYINDSASTSISKQEMREQKPLAKLNAQHKVESDRPLGKPLNEKLVPPETTSVNRPEVKAEVPNPPPSEKDAPHIPIQ